MRAGISSDLKVLSYFLVGMCVIASLGGSLLSFWRIEVVLLIPSQLKNMSFN